jgi:hypothetical protein
MDEHWDQTLAAMQNSIQRLERELADEKRAVNSVCKSAKRPSLYPDVDTAAQASIGSIRRDQWYGQGVSTAIREYLVIRRSANLGPATVNEIYDALVSGGYAFDAKDAENSKRGLRISLTKNTAIFHRLPDGSHFGLLEWYPEAKRQKTREDANAENETETVAQGAESDDVLDRQRARTRKRGEKPDQITNGEIKDGD